MRQRLAYCALGVEDVEGWMRFALDGLGLVPADRDGVRRLRMDDRAWRLAVRQSPADDIIYAGFELNGAAQLQAHRERIAAAGIACRDLSEAELEERQVTAGFHLNDADGLRIEFVTGLAAAADPFRSETVGGFKTGEQGLGHIVLAVKDLEAGIAFYETLGFSLSDFIAAPMGPQAKLRIAFFHCNARHHSLAIAVLPGGKRLNHLMIELDQVDDVLLGHRRCLAEGYKAGGIGRHPNDLMLSFYVRTPAGFDIECGWGGRTIEGDWTVTEYDHISIWGHESAAQ